MLVPVVDRPEPGVILTMRTPDLSSHAGQIAFPGGKIDETDRGPLAAALREAKEEIGLDARLIEPLGYLDLYLTFSGFRILPVVARVAPDYELALNASEVADAFEVPLDFLMGPENHQRHSREWKGIQRQYYAMPFRSGTSGVSRRASCAIYMSECTAPDVLVRPLAASASRSAALRGMEVIT